MRIQYNPEVSLGAILQVVTILASVFGAYSALQNADFKHDAELKSHAAQILEIKQRQETTQKEVREEIKDVKRGVDLINDKLTEVIIENARNHKQQRVQ